MEKKFSMDRLSNLPQHILHQILCFLSQKEAIQTCVLSKSWRYIGSTRPKSEFRESWFNGDKDKFLSVLDKSLQRYHDQNLGMEEFMVWMSEIDYESIMLVQNWTPKVLLKMGVKTFHLSFNTHESTYIDVPSVVFKAESLHNLYLERCKLNRNLINKVMLKNLKTLSLKQVAIGDEAFEKIISSCPSIENLSLIACKRLTTIKVNRHRYLNHFSFDDRFEPYQEQDDLISIEIDAPTLETIRIVGCPNWFHHHKYLPNLKSLFLNRVKISNTSFHFFFPVYMPIIECLTLDSCYGFTEIRLFLSDSFKHLVIKNLKKELMKAVNIDACNIVMFAYEGDIPQSDFYIRTTSRSWKSNIILSSHADLDNDAFSWFYNLKNLLEALSKSEISLRISLHRRGNQHHIEEYPRALIAANIIYNKPVLVEDLSLCGYFSSSSFPDFLNCLFDICHPKYMGQFLYPNDQSEREREENELTVFLLDFIYMKIEMRKYLWPRGLKEIRLHEFEGNEQELFSVDGVKARSRLIWG